MCPKKEPLLVRTQSQHLKQSKCLLIAAMLTVVALTQTCMAQEAAKPSAETITVGEQKQLFIDDLFFAAQEGIALRVNPALKTGEKNVVRDKPWESVTLNWVNVMKDAGKYRMWYECYDIEGWPTGDDTSFCYAESTDGKTWTKPNLGLFSYKGNEENNILFRMIGQKGGHSRVHGSCVIKDRRAPAEQRYKAISQGIYSDLGTPPHRIAGMYSPDGLHWTRYPEPICDQFGDSQFSTFWDSSLRKYVIYGRVGGRGRSLGRSESENFEFFEPLKLVLQADDNDPPDSDLYNSAALKYPFAEKIYFMFPSLFQHGPQTLDIRLAVSRDGVHWTWPEQSKPFIPLGKKGEFDSGSLYMGQGILRVGDELWQYYGGSTLTHDVNALEANVSRVFSRVVTRLDGYVSAEAGAQGGHFVTPPLLFQGNILKLNVKVREGGSVRVGLLDEKGLPLKGRGIEDCEPITGDLVDALVRWKTGGDVTARAGKPTSMRVEMTDAGLYAFRFTVGFAGKERDH